MVPLFGGGTSSNSANGGGGSSSIPGETYKLVSTVASEAMGIGKSSEVLTVLGGKASCRRKFVLNVHLVDEHGGLASRDLAIVASVAYAHDYSPVVRDEKPFLAEPPLFTTFNGVEFPAQDRPTRMISGRASFKLAISLLSSKCDNRLFRICFTPQTASPVSVGAGGSGVGGGGSDASPIICAPCYSKPIRSISRKRTQSSSSTHAISSSPPPPLLLLTGLETPPRPSSMPRSTHRTNNNNINSVGYNGGGSFESSDGKLGGGGTKFGATMTPSSPTTSSEDEDGKDVMHSVERCRGGGGPGRVHCSSRSSSVTSMHYLSQAAPGMGGGLSGKKMDGGGRNRCSNGGAVHSACGAVASLVHSTLSGGQGGGEGGGAGRLERLIETDHSGSSSGGMPSASCSPVSSDPVASNGQCSYGESLKVSSSSPPFSLSLRLSPSDSGSPTSGALTSESSYDNKQQQQQDGGPSRPQSSPLGSTAGVSGSRPQASNGAAAVTTTFPQSIATDSNNLNNNKCNGSRPFRPYATVGPCKVPMFPQGSDLQLGNGTSLTTSHAAATAQSFNVIKRSTDPTEGTSGGQQAVQQQGSTTTLLERVHQLGRVGSPVGAAAAAGRHGHQQPAQTNGKVDSLLHTCFALGTTTTEVRSNTGGGDDKFNSGLSEISLEEEEKSLQYIEVSLQEVSREVQRRKEELRSKRRRLLEDEARMHSIFQSSSWIESLNGRFTL